MCRFLKKRMTDQALRHMVWSVFSPLSRNCNADSSGCTESEIEKDESCIIASSILQKRCTYDTRRGSSPCGLLYGVRSFGTKEKRREQDRGSASVLQDVQAEFLPTCLPDADMETRVMIWCVFSPLGTGKRAALQPRNSC